MNETIDRNASPSTKHVSLFAFFGPFFAVIVLLGFGIAGWEEKVTRSELKAVVTKFQEWTLHDPVGFAKLDNNAMSLEELATRIDPKAVENLSDWPLDSTVKYDENNGAPSLCLETSDDGEYLTYNFETAGMSYGNSCKF